MLVIRRRPGRPGHRIGSAVDQQGADLAREQLGVGHPEQPAVGIAGERQLGVADGATEQVHVAGDVGRREMVEQITVALPAAAAELLGGLGDLLDLVRRHRERRERSEELALLVGIDEAPHGRALADTSWIEPDDVELRLDVGGENVPGVVADEVEHRVAGPAVVDEHRAEPMGLVGGGNACERQRDLTAPRLVVVERHLGGRALETVAAVAPVESRDDGRSWVVGGRGAARGDDHRCGGSRGENHQEGVAGTRTYAAERAERAE